MKDNGLIIAIIAAAGFCVVAFTPAVPLLLNTYDINNMYIIKATIGILSLVCGYGVVWSLFKKEDNDKPKREGAFHLRPIFLFAGVIIIIIAWFTDVSLWMADWSGLSNTFTYNNETLQGGIGTRIFVSAFTGLGVLLIRFSTYRDKERIHAASADESKYSGMLNKNDDKGGNISWWP